MSGIQAAFASMARAIGVGGEKFATGVFRLKVPIITTVSALSVGVLTRQYIFDWSGSLGPSMYPTLPEHAHLIFLSKRHALGRGIQIGDVIQARHPLFPNILIGKRVIGLPGDYVVRDAAESASVGGAPVPGVTDWDDSQTERAEPVMIQVPEGHVWVQGDNMAWSRDSRFYGPLPMGLIMAKTTAISDRVFRFESLTKEGKGLRKVEAWEEDAVLGTMEQNDGQKKARIYR